ncbi:hypothetical protein COOONC_07184 [Cooperia oncophora]
MGIILSAEIYLFPLQVQHSNVYVPIDEKSREVNCRRATVEFGNEPADKGQDHQRSQDKINAFGDLSDWCAAANFSSKNSFQQP